MKTINERFPRPYDISALGWLTWGVVGISVLSGLIGGASRQVAAFLMNAFGVVVVLNGVNFALDGLQSYETARDIESTELTPAADVPDASSVVELEGTVESNGHVLESRYTHTDCVAHRYEYYERESTTHGTNQGHTHGSKWRLEADGGAEIPFRVADDSGTAGVDPQDAEMSLTEESNVGLLGEWFGSEKEVEYRLDVGETVHVRGASLDGDDDGRMSDPHVGATDDQPLHVADATEADVVGRHVASGRKRLLSAVVVALVGAGIVYLPPV
jgi:hypothetical protein